MYISKLILVLLFPLAAQAAEFGMAGCGPGSVLMGQKTGQIFAATTNHSTSGQGFAITSGTSNCSKEEKKSAFFQYNLRDLEKDLARGEGPTLAALKILLEENP